MAGARTLQKVVGAAKESHYARVPCIKTVGEHIGERFGDIVISEKRVGIGQTLDLSGGYWGANDILVGVVSARKIEVVKSARKAVLAVNIGITENCSFTSDMFVVDLDEKFDGKSS